jgi:hypothetical protein
MSETTAGGGTPELRPRHFEKTEGLVIRTAGDLPPEHLARRARRGPFTEELGDPRPQRPRLVSSAEGGLDRVLLTIPAYAVGSPPLAERYRELLDVLPKTATLVILTHDPVRAEVEGWVREAGRAQTDEVISVPSHLHFSVWAEDGYAVVSDGGGDGDGAGGRTFFVEPYSFPRYGDGLIADFVSTATALGKTQAPLYFQGGNLLIGDEFFLIGADYPANSLEYVGSVITPQPGERPQDLIRRLYGEYLDSSREVIYVGSTIPVPAQQEREVQIGGERWTEVIYTGNEEGTVQPLFHIDMFVSLAGRGNDGRYRLLVGDPALAAELLGQPVPPHAMREVYDNIARGLERQGFAVTRNPLPLVYLDDPRERLRMWYFATANNALVEIRPDGTRQVFMPTYGHGAWPELQATDRRNAEIWRGLGFQPRLLGDFHPFAENLGAVHCIKKYLSRS